MNSNTDLRYRAMPSAVGEKLGEEVAILNVETGIYFGLQGVGAEVWELLDKAPTVDEIVAHLVQVYEVDETRCRADVVALLASLQEAQLVKVEA